MQQMTLRTVYYIIKTKHRQWDVLLKYCHQPTTYVKTTTTLDQAGRETVQNSYLFLLAY